MSAGMQFFLLFILFCVIGCVLEWMCTRRQQNRRTNLPPPSPMCSRGFQYRD